jgi:hypothetical protein
MAHTVKALNIFGWVDISKAGFDDNSIGRSIKTVSPSQHDCHWGGINPLWQGVY